MTILLQDNFAIATLMGDHYREIAEAWQETRRVDERIERLAKLGNKGREDTAQILNAMIFAGVTAAERERYQTRLGYHDVALIEALQENREQLDASNERLEAHIEKAYELEDGRRVFRTEDGTRVIDEHGGAIDAAVIDPDTIEAWRPSAERYLAERERRDALVREQQELIEYQDRLDTAQSQLETGNLTEDDLSALDDLLQDAPTAVRRRLPDADPASLGNTMSDQSQDAGAPVIENAEAAMPGTVLGLNGTNG